MGKVIVTLRLTNLSDVHLSRHGFRKAKPRQLDVAALVDTGATRLHLKPSVIRKLGLQELDVVTSQTTNGACLRRRYDSVRLELMGRYGDFQVIQIPETVPNLLGQIPLEDLDLVVDSKGRKLIGNPEHGGEQMSEEY